MIGNEITFMESPLRLESKFTANDIASSCLELSSLYIVRAPEPNQILLHEFFH